MPPAKPTPPVSTPPAAKPAKPGRASPARKPPPSTALTHERIADDMDAFRRAGGKIEVLGNTRTLTRIGTDDAALAPRPATAPQRKRAR